VKLNPERTVLPVIEEFQNAALNFALTNVATRATADEVVAALS
jgi:hypothetical protein